MVVVTINENTICVLMCSVVSSKHVLANNAECLQDAEIKGSVPVMQLYKAEFVLSFSLFVYLEVCVLLS